MKLIQLSDKEDIFRILHGLRLYNKQVNLIIEFHNHIPENNQLKKEIIDTEELIKNLEEYYDWSD